MAINDNPIDAMKITWICRFHPTDWFHEVGCPHMDWTKEQLQSALISQKKTVAYLREQYLDRRLGI